jgi:hypothetical protein
LRVASFAGMDKKQIKSAGFGSHHPGFRDKTTDGNQQSYR